MLGGWVVDVLGFEADYTQDAQTCICINIKQPTMGGKSEKVKDSGPTGRFSGLEEGTITEFWGSRICKTRVGLGLTELELYR